MILWVCWLVFCSRLVQMAQLEYLMCLKSWFGIIDVVEIK